VRSQGNNLYILCESQTYPDDRAIVSRLQQAFSQKPLEFLGPEGSAEIHRIICYGRVIGEAQPRWARAIHLTHHTHAETGVAEPPSTDAELVAKAPAMLALARQGNPTAIAHYLSSSLSSFGVGIRAKLDKHQSANAPFQRLLILCESGYTPDPALLATPIAQRLRELELSQFRDAVVFGQVSGEHRPEWMVRIDLTPPDEIVQEWARWGDVQAIARQLNRFLAGHDITLTALLKEATLHLSCSNQAGAVPEKATVLETILPALELLSPQGIHAAVIYGIASGTVASATDVAPGWVHLVDLNAPESGRDLTTLELAKQGNLDAIGFLLTRLLNPNLDDMLASGGIQVQIRQKGDLLHILTEAPNCPRRDAVVPAVVRRLKSLQIPGISGLRLYGRQAGQKQPLWSYGVDFEPRQQQRLVPEANPEFAASEVHVDELLAPAGAIVLWSELPEEGIGASIRRLYAQTIEGMQRSLIRTQLFVPTENPALSASLVPLNTKASSDRRQLKVALLWGAIGTLLVLQLDWLLGYWVRYSGQQAANPPQPDTPTVVTPASPLPEIGLNQKPQAGKDFNTSPFTQPGNDSLAANSEPDDANRELPASPLQAKAETLLAQQGEGFPSFNSRQLDGQIELYRRYLELNGPPDVLVVGSSRALRGVDPVALEAALAKQGYEDVQVFNFGINGATAQVIDLVVRQLLPQDKRPKLILFADGARAFNSGRVDITYNGVAASEGYKALVAGNLPIPSSVVAQVPNAKPQGEQSPTDNGTAAPMNLYQRWNEVLNQQLAAVSTIYRQRDRLKTQLREQFTAILPIELLPADVIATSDSLIDSSPSASASGAETAIADIQTAVDIDGFLPLSVQFNPVTYYQKYARVSGDYDSDYDSFTLQGVQTEAMLSLARYAQEQQIPFVFVNLPLTQEYLDPVRKRHEQDFQKFMLQLAQTNDFFYRNLGNDFLTKPRYFSDPSHLNRYGGYEVSQRLARDVMIPWQVTR
jgi:hypothetical protein